MNKMSLLNLNLLFVSTNNLILQATVALCLNLTLSFFKIPALFLHGLHTYIHPDDVNPPTGGGVRAAIRRPGAASDPELKPRKRSKDKLEFDESKAQIFRLRLTDAHLQTRIYFASFHGVFNSVVIAVSCLCLHNSLPVSEASSGFTSNGSIVPILLGLAGSCRVLLLIARVSFERSASKKSEKQLSLISGLLGFALGLLVLLEILPTRVFDFGFGSLDGFGKFSVSVFMGCVAGFLVMPAARSARAFWLGTDQIRCNLSIIYCGWIARVLLYANYLLTIFTSLLWITPFANLLVKKHADDSGGSHLLGKADVLVGNVGMTNSDFDKFRTWCLLVSGLLQIAILRPSLQMYLNEAVLSWYQRLHASKVPDLDFSRVKVFLHNHYLCLVLLQFFAPPALVLLFLGLSQSYENLLNNFQPLCSFLHCSALLKQVPLFMAWWITFVWAVLTSANLVLYRHGILYVS